MALELASITCTRSPKTIFNNHSGILKRHFLPSELAKECENTSALTGLGAHALKIPLAAGFSKSSSNIPTISSREIHDIYCYPSPSTAPSPNLKNGSSFPSIPPEGANTTPVRIMQTRVRPDSAASAKFSHLAQTS